MITRIELYMRGFKGLASKHVTIPQKQFYVVYGFWYLIFTEIRTMFVEFESNYLIIIITIYI